MVSRVVMKLVQYAAINSLWFVFFYLWGFTLHRAPGGELRRSLVLLLAIVAAYALVAALWIWHNRRIYRRKGPRRRIPAVHVRTGYDTLGRRITCDSNLLSEQYLLITVAGAQKTYLSAAADRAVATARMAANVG